MEAVADHDFNGRNSQELSVKKGSLLKILTSTLKNKEWLRAEHDGHEGLVPANYVTMKPQNWYHGNLSRQGAEILLRDEQKDGAFLIRESESTPGDFSVSVKFTIGGVQHFKICRNAEGKYYLWTVKFSSLNQLVDYHRTPSKTLQLLFTDPVSNKPKVVALWDFQPKEEGMLPFRKGDVISLLDKTSHRDWWRGECHGNEGVFPKTYVHEKDTK